MATEKEKPKTKADTHDAGELLVALTLGIGMVASGCGLFIGGMRRIG
jgi:hypothetical protein